MSRNSKGILAVVGSSMAIFWPGALIFGFPGVMAPFWQEMFQVGRGAIGNALFFLLASLGIFMFLVGRWQERYGTRAMITVGAIICVLGTIVIAYASCLIMLYSWAVLMGISSCFILIPALTTVQRWYPEKRGLVSGTVNLVFGLSAAIMSPLFGKMLISMGYFGMNITIAILALITGLGAAYLARSPEASSSVAGQMLGSETGTGTRNKKGAGKEGAGTSAEINIDIETNAKTNVKTVTETALNRSGRLAGSLTVNESVRTQSFWFLWITWAMMGAAGISMVMLSTSYGLSKGFALESAVVILTAFNITNGAGRLVTGYFSDIIGRTQIMSITFFAAGGAYFILPHADGLLECAVLASVVGLAFGTLFAVSAPLVSDCFGLRHFGAIFGLVFTSYGFFSGALGPSLSGYLLDMTESNFVLVFLYLGVFCMLSGLCIRRVLPP